MTVDIDFYYSLGSRYSYLASTQLERIEERYDCRFNWKPLQSRILMKRRGMDPFEDDPVSGQYRWPYREYDAKSWAAFYGVPFHEPSNRDKTLLAPFACLAAGKQNAIEAYSRRLFLGIFRDDAEIDEGVLKELAAELGLEEERFHEDLQSAETAARHHAIVDEAQARGAFGVPSFFLGGRLFWGNDRLCLLEAALAGLELPQFQVP